LFAGCFAKYGMYYFSILFLLTPLSLDVSCTKLDNKVQATLWPVIRLSLNLLLGCIIKMKQNKTKPTMTVISRGKKIYSYLC